MSRNDGLQSHRKVSVTVSRASADVTHRHKISGPMSCQTNIQVNYISSIEHHEWKELREL